MDILYEDDDIIIVHKPAGISTQTSRIGEADCVSELKKILYAEHPKQGEPYLGVIHRLDQPVEGILVFAKDPYAAAALSKDVQNNAVKKEYMALVHSEADLPKNTVQLTDFIIKDGSTNTSRICSKDEKGAKKAELRYEKVDERIIMPGEGDFRVYRLKIHLITGRHHQIRLQLSHAGMPVLGDGKYGFVPEGYKGPLCLVAYDLTICHPRTGRSMEFSIESESLKGK